MIYLILKGRIGNQLFMFSTAYTLWRMRGSKELIVIDDADNQCHNYLNSLMEYPLENVKFVHDRKYLNSYKYWLKKRDYIKYQIAVSKMSYREKYLYELKNQIKFNRKGLFICENGYMDYPVKMPRNILVDGYFQSEKFFEKYKNEIIKIFSLKEEVNHSNYPNLELIRSRNTVCLSIKVQHNVGSEMYDVCSKEYWEQAIQYMTEHVENPLFFVCSDNVLYVKENLIDCNRYDIIEQAFDYPVHISLAVMAQCKHFIIGNTSFGWWAQYLCENENKIVVTPSRWYGIDVPCDIYQENWHSIEV